MKIIYVTHTRFPTPKAHGHQIAQVCSALGCLGHDVTLVHPTIWTGIKEDPYVYYGVDNNFKIEKIGIFDALQSRFVPGSLAFVVSMWSYRRALRPFLEDGCFEADVFYCRSWEVLPPLLQKNKRVILELHSLPGFSRRRFVKNCNQCFRVACLTSALQKEIVAWGVDEKRTVVEPDGVDCSRFNNLPSGDETKDDRLPKNCWVIGYCGSFFARNSLEKGVGELLKALALLKKGEARCFGHIVGGSERQEKQYEKQAERLGLTTNDVRFEGRIWAGNVATTIAGFDICVYPAPASRHPYFVRDTSPLKLFEYLASGRPTVCADIPPIRDIVSEEHVTFCKPGNPTSLASAVSDVLLHYDEALRRASKGKELVKKYDWIERMKRILERVN